MRVAFCNFDLEPWRMDLAIKMAKEFRKRGNACFYYSYRENINDIIGNQSVEFQNVEFSKYKFNESITKESKKFSAEELNFIGQYSRNLNNVFNRPASQNIKLISEINVFLEKLSLAQKENHIDLFIIWGGERYRERAIVEFARKYDKKFFMLEFGYFRPFTLTIENIGLNYNNCLSREAEFYDKLYNDIEIKLSDITEPKKAFLDKNGSLKVNFSLKNYILKFLSIKKTSKPKLNLNKSYVFIPFQVESDSQIIEFSPHVKTMQNLVALACEAVTDYNIRYKQNLAIIFKPHPVDKRVSIRSILQKMKYYPHAEVSFHETTQELIRHADFIVTINSTVGLEALMMKTPVITLGDTFYNIPELVTNCKNYDELPDLIHQVANSVINEKFMLKYMKYLRDEYFHEIFFEGADPSSIKSLVDRLLVER